MTKKHSQWSSIARHPRFQEHCQRKNRFLFFWWGVGVGMYLLLLIGAGYYPEIMKTRIAGRLNVGYAMFILNFFSTWAIALFYARKADREFDPRTRQLLDEFGKGGEQ